MLSRISTILVLILLGATYVVNALEINLEYVGKIECTSLKGTEFKSFEIFKKTRQGGYRIRGVSISDIYSNYKVCLLYTSPSPRDS
jgi:hypothetical protein